MRKLKNKTFILLLAILTTFLITILCVFNFILYNKEYKDIKDRLLRIELTHNDFFPKFNKPINDKKPMFIDSIVYVVSFDSSMNIREVINYTENGVSKLDIEKLALDYINNNDLKGNNIRNLYFHKYSYSYRNNNLIIMDNTEVSNRLVKTLLISFFLFAILEAIIVFVVIRITKWIVGPVQESFDKQKQFIYDASHELKTPLSVIMASAETLQENPKENKWIKTIQDESERMNKLVVDLLDLAKSENKNDEKYSINNLSKIIEKTCLTFESIIYEKGLKLNLDIDEKIEFACHPDRIKQLVGILIDNAIKHSLAGSKITVSLKKNKDHIIVEVVNKGEPIPKDEQTKIFERFYRLDESRNRNENRYGLGLAIAKNIVMNHKGNICVSCENGYTTFRITFKSL